MSDPTQAPATPFGRFDLGPEIGRGAMGVVHDALQRDLGRHVALKLLPRDRLQDPSRVEAFRAEARAAARVRHPGLVEVFDVGIVDDQPYLAMELVDGRDLESELEDGPLEPREAARLVAEVARAVHALHEHGIVHRDIKPSNVLVDRDGHARVTDFGLAQARGDGASNQPGVLEGTPGAMAPEQISARFGPVGIRSDIWSIGALLYRLSTGHGPHPGSSAVELIVATIEHTVQPARTVRPTVPVEVDAIADRCLQRDPSRRYRSAAALADDLERFLHEEALDVRLPGAVNRAVNRARSRPALTAHVAGVLLLWGVTFVDYALLGVTDLAFFGVTTGLAGAAVLASFGLDRLARVHRHASWPPIAWVLFDAAALCTVAALGDGPSSAAVQAFPLLVATAALWRLERPIVVATLASITAYTSLAVWAEISESSFRRPLATYLIALLTQLLTGAVVLRVARHARLVAELAARRRKQPASRQALTDLAPGTDRVPSEGDQG